MTLVADTLDGGGQLAEITEQQITDPDTSHEVDADIVSGRYSL